MTSEAWLSDAAPSPAEYVPKPNEPVAEAGQVGAVDVASELEADGVDTSFDLVVAFATKGFVILTGPSGTGKSREVLRLGYALERLCDPDSAQQGASATVALVPVGADWTDARRLLGYSSPFGAARTNEEGETTNETYVITDALRLLLRASDPERSQIPHLLVLDEMNLSHVERYFSPFLSLMEARRATRDLREKPLVSREHVSIIADVLKAERPDSLEAKAAAHLTQSGRGLVVPSNLLIVGTVNVDETTYMFSPKVLDRANVIELRTVRPRDYIDKVTVSERRLSYQQARDVLVRSIAEHRAGALAALTPKGKIEAAVKLASVDASYTEPLLSGLRNMLDGAYKLLEGVSFDFGYRPINEAFDYLYFWLYASRIERGDDEDAAEHWQQAVDQIFLQKILPKLHGNRRQLGGSLDALSAFLNGETASGATPAAFRIADGPEVRIEEDERLLLGIDGQMPLSRAKLQRMSNRLAAVGHVSFVQ